MKSYIIIAVSSLILFSGAYAQAATQSELDAKCEQARDTRLVPLRQQMTAECIAEGKKDKKQCEAAYKNHNGRVGNGALPFYDIPECDKAHKNKSSSKRR